MQSINKGVIAKPRVCLFSLRNIERHVARCADYEFEDLICEVDDVELLTPESHTWFAFNRKIANQLARRMSIACLNPGIRKIRFNKNYDLFFAICQSPRDLLSLSAIKGWKKNCKTSVCWLEEIWAGEIHKYIGHLKILSQFDYVVLSFSQSLQAVQNAIQSTCSYVPVGVDAILFCPNPNHQARSIDIYSMGRHSSKTHQSFLKLADDGKIFYIYDTISNMYTLYPKQHRSFVANIAKRSRYFVTYVAKRDRQCETHGQQESGYRFYEGAASGTIMIGEAPETQAFRKQFDWPDAVIHVPYDTVDVSDILADLDSQPERLEKARRNNIIQSLLRHDWAYRWRAILELVGLKPRPALIAREERLKKLAEEIKKNS